MDSSPPRDGAEQFRAASSWLSSSPAAGNLVNTVKLELYGLYKYITTSSGPTGPRPSIFSPTPRAKYDAWTSSFVKYTTTNIGLLVAQTRYVEIARGLGWQSEGWEQDDEEIDLDNLDDESSRVQGKGKGKPSAGMGAGVSVMTQGVEEPSTQTLSSPIHEAVIDNSPERLRGLLGGACSLVNARDTYGYTPLHLAADRGHFSLVEILLDAGADKDLLDEDGQTPYMLAKISGREDIGTILRSS